MAAPSPPPRPRLARALAALVLLLAAALLGWLAWAHPWELLATGLSTVAFGLPYAAALIPGVWIRRGAPLGSAALALERRRPVWRALSQLYLDTELDARDLADIAAVVAASGYSEAEAEAILYRELHPVLLANLTSMAGEWAGFDLVWLEARILAARPRRAAVALIPGKWLVRRPWAAIRAELASLQR